MLGYGYDEESSGITNAGFGPDAGMIFSVKGNEDFSHDLFHYYSAKFREGIKANQTVEEGMAYCWGNAYYANKNGEMITEHTLLLQLKQYLMEHPHAKVYELYINDEKIFNDLSVYISVKSVISGVLCQEVEKKRGLPGILTLIKCGPGDELFLKQLDSLIGVNKSNFEHKVRELLR